MASYHGPGPLQLPIKMHTGPKFNMSFTLHRNTMILLQDQRQLECTPQYSYSSYDLLSWQNITTSLNVCWQSLAQQQTISKYILASIEHVDHINSIVIEYFVHSYSLETFYFNQVKSYGKMKICIRSKKTWFSKVRQVINTYHQQLIGNWMPQRDEEICRV